MKKRGAPDIGDWVDMKIAEWHNGNGFDMPLHAYLHMHRWQYGEFVKDASALPYGTEELYARETDKRWRVHWDFWPFSRRIPIWWRNIVPQFGNDRFHRRTIMFPLLGFGSLDIALWEFRRKDPDCHVCNPAHWYQ